MDVTEFTAGNPEVAGLDAIDGQVFVVENNLTVSKVDT